MIFICLNPQYKIVICRDAYRTFNFMLLTGSCVDMPRHGSAQSWVIRMPGLMTMRVSKRLSSSGRGVSFPSFPIVISDELSRGLLLDTVSMCSISEQVGMLIFG